MTYILAVARYAMLYLFILLLFYYLFILLFILAAMTYNQVHYFRISHLAG